MDKLEIILLIIIYVLMIIISVKPFKIASNNSQLDSPVFAAFFWPVIWIILTIIAIIHGYKIILKRDE